VDGYYLNTVDDTPTLLSVSLFSDDPFVPPSFFELKDGNVWNDAYVAVSSVDDYNGLTFQLPDGVPDTTRLVCSVSCGILSCETGEGLTTFYACLDESGEEFPPSLYFYGPDAVVPFGCSPIQLKEHPVQ
jgi:hypothetical protein